MILVVDDDRSIRLALKLLLGRAGYEVELSASPAEAIDVVRASSPQLVLLDMNFTCETSGDEGLTLLKQIKLLRPEVPVILMTAWGSIQLAVAGVKAGALDFITKPWDNRVLLKRVAETIRLSSSDGGGDDFDRSLIVGESPGLMAVLDMVERVSRTDAPVLIMGENGTGKELIAETIHRNSPRAAAPFVKVNLGGVAQSLFESEMFGHRRGAFTGAVADRKGRFEIADTGTIFLDEIGDLDMSCQVKLLRVLQEHTFEPLGDSRPRKVDVRVVSATNANLNAMVAANEFREDLFYRLNLITVTLPPLRERASDIALLARHFASRHVADGRCRRAEFTADALEYLSRLPYPGNIRELKNLVDRTVIISDSPVMDVGDIERSIAVGAGSEPVPVTIGDAERSMIVRALEANGGNLSRTAAQLGISRQALYRRMEKFGIGTA